MDNGDAYLRSASSFVFFYILVSSRFLHGLSPLRYPWDRFSRMDRRLGWLACLRWEKSRVQGRSVGMIMGMQHDRGFARMGSSWSSTASRSADAGMLACLPAASRSPFTTLLSNLVHSVCCLFQPTYILTQQQQQQTHRQTDRTSRNAHSRVACIVHLAWWCCRADPSVCRGQKRKMHDTPTC